MPIANDGSKPSLLPARTALAWRAFASLRFTLPLSRGAEAAAAAHRFRERVHRMKISLHEGGDDHLGNAVTATDGEGLITEVDQNNTDLAAVSASIVPGVLSTVMPCFRASPERGRIWAS